MPGENRTLEEHIADLELALNFSETGGRSVPVRDHAGTQGEEDDHADADGTDGQGDDRYRHACL